MIFKKYFVIYFMLLMHEAHRIRSGEYVTENTIAGYEKLNVRNDTGQPGTLNNGRGWVHSTSNERLAHLDNLFENNSISYGDFTGVYEKTYNSSSPAHNVTSKNIQSSNVIYNVNVIIRFSFLVLAFLGLIFNCLSFLIIVKQGLIEMGIWVYMATLGVVDNMALIMSIFTVFQVPPYDYVSHLFNANNASCKMLTSFRYVWNMVSYYIVCLVTTERCVLIVSPFKTPTGQNRAVIKVILVSMTVFIIQACYLYPFFGIVEVNLTDSSTDILRICMIIPEYLNYLTYLIVIDMVLYAILPIVIILVANSLIIFALIRRARNKTLCAAGKNVDKDKNITYMLLGISSYFVFTITPYLIYLNTWQFFYASFKVLRG